MAVLPCSLSGPVALTWGEKRGMVGCALQQQPAYRAGEVKEGYMVARAGKSAGLVCLTAQLAACLNDCVCIANDHMVTEP